MVLYLQKQGINKQHYMNETTKNQLFENSNIMLTL